MEITKSLISAATAIIMLLTGCATKPEQSGSPAEGGDTNITEETTMELTQKTFAADEQHVKLIGRTGEAEGIRWLALSASGVEFTFTGTSAAFTIVGDNMITNAEKQPRYAVYINGEQTMDNLVDSAEATVTVFTADEAQETTVKLLKLSEAQESTMGIKDISIPSVGEAKPTAEKELKIEFIGDSITCGYGVDDEDRDHHFKCSTEDATKAYAFKTAQALDADYSLVSYSGNGIISGYSNDGKKVESQQVPPVYTKFAKSWGNYNGIFNVSDLDWDFSKFQPDFVVINLGTNDASYTKGDKEKVLEYADAYAEFLKVVREKNPNAHIICSLGVMGADLMVGVKKAAEKYTEETGVPVTVVTAASGQYETTLMSEMEKSEAPTLFQVNGPVGLANWKDYCYDLSGSQLYGELTSDSFALKDGDAVTSIAYVIETYGIIYNKELLTAAGYTQDDIKGFADLKKVADDIQARKAELGVDGAFTSAGMDGSSDWRFKTHLANLPIYYEYKADGISSTDAIKGTYLDNYKQIWDLYITDSTCDPTLLASKTGNDAVAEFVGKKAVFYQNGTWAYSDVKDLGDDNLGMLPIYIGVDGEENQGLCTGSENYWCVNNQSSEADIQATLDFLYWCVTSEAGTSAMADKMGFVIPFKKAKDSTNPLIAIANDYVAAGKTSVDWCFSTMPSEEWKNGVGSALTAYAAGTGDWDAVVTAFVDGWASEYKLANG